MQEAAFISVTSSDFGQAGLSAHVQVSALISCVSKNSASLGLGLVSCISKNCVSWC